MLAALLLCFGAPTFAHADNINVVFQATPLFSDSNIVPGDTVTRSVTVTNTSGVSQDVYVKALNGVSTGSLGDKLLLTVTDGDATPISSLPLSTLVNGASQLLQSGLPDGSTATYDFSIYFDSSAGNEYQNSTLGFDLCVGFEGASGDTCISDTSGGSTNTGGNTGSTVTNSSSGGGGTLSGASAVGYQTSAGSGAAFISNHTPGGLVLGASTGPNGTLGLGNGTSHGGGKIGSGTSTEVAIAEGSTTSNTDQLAAVGALGINLLGGWPWWWWIPFLLLLIILLYYWYKRRKDNKNL